MTKSIVLLTLISVILFMSRGITGPINSLYVASLGASYVVIGVLGTVTSLATILFSYAWGRASDALGRRKVFLTLGLLVIAACNGLTALARHYGVLFPLNFISAVAQAAYLTGSLALMGDLLERSSRARGRKMGVYRGLASLGFGVMAYFSGSVADSLSLNATFGIAVVLLGVAFVLALNVDEAEGSIGAGQGIGDNQGIGTSQSAGGTSSQPSRDTSPQVVSVETETPVASLPLSPLLVAAFLWSLVTGAVYAVWANYMVSELGYSQAQMSRLWALASLSEFPLMVVAGHFSDRLGRLPMLSLGFLAWALVFLGYVVLPGMPGILAVQLLRGFAYSAFTATAMTYAAEVRVRAQRGHASGLYNSAGGVGAILGASLGGALAQFAGFRLMILSQAALIFAGAVYLAIVALRHRKSIWLQ